MNVVEFAYQIVEMNQEIELLRAEVAELREYERKYNALLDSSIDHGEKMLGTMLEYAVRKADESKQDIPGWIEWNGGECPVDADTKVDVKFRDGGGCLWEDDMYTAGDWNWAHYGRHCDIFAYRIVK